jgi:nucleoside-diphosphate-sugar epimerase
MTILVTGGTGLVGTRFLRRFAESRSDVRALVRPGKDVPAGVTVVEGDLLNPESLTRAVDGISAVVHLAAVLRTPDADDIWRANLEGTRTLIDAVKSHAPDARFIMASTGLVYDGTELGRPAREDDAVAPSMPYPASKLAAENELRESGLTWSILRLAFVYGEDDGHLQSAPPLLTSWGWHPALGVSLIHHRDVATAVDLALTGAMDGHVVNIVDEAPVTIYEIAEIVGKPIDPSNEAVTSPWRARTDGSLARSLGFQPKVPTVYQASRDNSL